MFRGTKIRHKFYFPFLVTDIDSISITYVQKGKKVLTKSFSEIYTVKDHPFWIVTVLDENETALFSYGARPKDSLILIEVRAELTDGTIVVSDVIKDRVYESLDCITDSSGEIRRNVVYSGASGYGDVYTFNPNYHPVKINWDEELEDFTFVYQIALVGEIEDVIFHGGSYDKS